MAESGVRFIRKNGRVIPIRDSSGGGGAEVHPHNMRVIKRVAQEHGVSEDRVKKFAINFGAGASSKWSGDAQGDFELHAQRAFGSENPNSPSNRAGRNAAIRSDRRKLTLALGAAALGIAYAGERHLVNRALRLKGSV